MIGIYQQGSDCLALIRNQMVVTKQDILLYSMLCLKKFYHVLDGTGLPIEETWSIMSIGENQADVLGLYLARQVCKACACGKLCMFTMLVPDYYLN